MDPYHEMDGFRFGEFTLDMKARYLLQEGRVIPLTPKELKTLVVLLESAGAAVAREKLIRQVWPDSFVSDGSLTRNISVLRKYLGDGVIQTVPKYGYRFASSVTELRSNNDSAPQCPEILSAMADQLTSTAPTKAGGPPRASRGVKERQLRAAMMLFAAILTIAGGLFASFRYGQRGRALPTPPNRLAVLPFSNLSKQVDADDLVDGLAEELTTRLGQLDADRVRVLAPGSSKLYIGTAKSPAQISRELDVQYLVDGTIQVMSQEVELTVHLIDGHDQAMLWSGKFTRPLSQLPQIRKEATENIAKQIQIKILSRASDHVYSTDSPGPLAVQAFLHRRFEREYRTVASLAARVMASPEE